MAERIRESQPIPWVASHLNQIRQILFDHRNFRLSRLEKNGLLSGEPLIELGQDVYDFQARRLSEMPLCEAWDQIAKECGLPEGFIIRNGAVTSIEATGTSGKVDSKPHTYLEKIDASGEKIILCLTGSQFVVPLDSNAYEKGQRMHKLHEMAVEAGRDDLYRILPYNIGIIYGSAADIEEVLGLRFEEATELLHSYNI